LFTVSDSDEARVLAAARALAAGDAARAWAWYANEPLPEFSGRTAQQLVRQGRADAVLRLLAMYDAGAAG
jgi:hypothetical protein